MKTDISKQGNKLQLRLAISIVLGFLLLDLYFIKNSHDAFLDNAEKAVLQKLQAVAKSAGLMIDGDAHDALITRYRKKDDILTNEQDSTYLAIKKVLFDLQKGNNIETGMYTMFFKDDVEGDHKNKSFYFGVASENPFFRHPYDSAPPELIEKYYEGGVVHPYGDDHGTWLSAFEPIRNSEGKVVGVVQADQKFDSFIAEAREKLIQNVLISLGLLVLVSLIMFVSTRWWVRLSLKEQSEIDWVKNGIARINEVLRGEKKIDKLSQDLVTFMSRYMNAQVGAIYLMDEFDMLKRVGGFAFALNPVEENELRAGEGLVGQVAREGKTILMENVPKDYLKVSSGLGNAAPSCIIVTPFKYEGKVKGVMEFGLMSPLTAAQKDFLEKSLENIAIGINSTELRVRTEELLEETQQQAEELQVQQEELRQSNAELEEKAGLLKRQNDELEIAKESLAKQSKELETASRYKSEFLANMSHELRTPLNSILILAKLLKDNKGGNLTEKQEEFARVIHMSGSELLNLINDILNLAKIESGQTELILEQVETEEITENLKAMFGEQARQKNIEFNLSMDEEFPEIIGTDHKRLSQVLKNLISNAFKFTDEGGSVSLNFELADKAQTFKKASLNSLDKVLMLSVTDTGIGIPKDKQEIVFEAFRQSDGSTSRKYGGTGLGLSISKEIVSLLGGEMQLKSVEGEESTFTVFLPVESRAVDNGEKNTSAPVQIVESPQEAPLKEPKEEPVAPVVAESPSAPNKTVLIHENDDKLGEMMKKEASKRGFSVVLNGESDSLEETIRDKKPEAVIINLNRIQDEKRQIIENLQTGTYGCSPVIQLIASGSTSASEFGLSGPSVLPCPFNPDQLRHSLDHIENQIRLGGSRLLIVEDDRNQNQSMGALLTEEGYKVDSAYSGAEAMKKLGDQSFDCVILDLGLPDMTGDQLLDLIREHPEKNGVPVIVYTGKDMAKEEEAQLRKKSNTIILKTENSYNRLMEELALLRNKVKRQGIQKGPSLPQKEAKGPGPVLAEPTPAPPKQEVTDKTLQGKTILLVDDDIRNVFALSSILEQESVHIVTAFDGKQAIQKLEEHNDIDAILMDIMMPEMNGYEAMQEIRKKSQYKDLPIIALTAKAMKGDKEKCIEAGASDYIPKPVDTDKLLSVLRIWMHQG